MRKDRYRGKRKARVQALLAATVASFKRLGVLGVLSNASDRPWWLNRPPAAHFVRLRLLGMAPRAAHGSQTTTRPPNASPQPPGPPP